MRFISKILAVFCVTAGTPSYAQDSDQSLPLMLGQIITVASNFCPRFTDDANGALMPIAQHTGLFSLLGTRFGGDGVTTFALPDLRGRTIIGDGQGPGLSSFAPGQAGGQESVTLSIAQMPLHKHIGNLIGSTGEPNSAIVKNGALPTFTTPQYSRAVPPSIAMAPGSVTTESAGGSQPVPLRDPFLALRYCIVTYGSYPSR